MAYRFQHVGGGAQLALGHRALDDLADVLSMIGVLPALMRSTFACWGSTPMTSCPSFARQPAETAPTYPRPMMLIFIAADLRVIVSGP